MPFRPDLYRILVDSVEAFAIIVLDLDARVISWNPGAERIFGYRAEEIIGEDGAVLFTEEDRAAGVPAAEIAEALRTGSAPDVRWHLRKDGERIWVDGVARALRDEGGAPVAVAKVVRDVSLQGQQGEAARHAEAERERLLESMTEGLLVARADRNVVEVNPAAAALHGYATPAEMLVHLDDLAELFQVFDPESGAPLPVEVWPISRALRGERFTDYRLRVLRKDTGAEGVWSYGGTPVFEPQGPLSRALVTIRDVTAEVEAQRALRELNAGLEARVAKRAQEVRRLTAEVLLAEERERRRVTELLHDHVQQLLVAAQMRAHQLEEGAPTLEAARQQGAALNALLSEAIEATRTLTAELVPPALDGGVEEAFRWLAGHFEKAYGLHVEADPGAGSDVPPAPRNLLLRLARELLFNVVKHAGTDRARLSLREEGGGWALRVEDEGVGFDPQAQHADRDGGLGLASVRERLESVGGRLEVDGRPGEGARMTVWLPAV